MSIFELYASGVPMLFPTQEFAGKLYARYKDRGIFSELSYNQVLGLPSKSAIQCGALDPNDYQDDEIMMYWIAKSDFYDSDNLKHLVYFDSFEELEHLLNTFDVREASRKMTEHHRVRSARAFAAWTRVLETASRQIAAGSR
jgi:hypothetical protein